MTHAGTTPIRILSTLTLVVVFGLAAAAQEVPYFVTYDHHLEEPGNLEVSVFSTVGLPRPGERTFVAPYMEFEYGTTGWWTSELYVEGQSTSNDSAIFTGWRFENRFHVLRREHFVNPVLYIEYEHLNEADKIAKEIAGNAAEMGGSNSDLRRERAHELETKLILSSNVHDWNVSENFIVEKNLSADEGFEFGYAIGVSHPLSSLASGEKCRLCRENFVAGLEAYGGLGSTLGFGLHDTAHYIAPVVSWQLSDNSVIHFSPSLGVTKGSNPVLLRFGYSYEFQGFGGKLAAFLRGKH